MIYEESLLNVLIDHIVILDETGDTEDYHNPASGPATPAQPRSIGGQPEPQQQVPSVDVDPLTPRPPIPDPEKCRLVQEHLLLYLHACNCQQAECTSIAGCRTMKIVLDHMPDCRDSRACPVYSCISTRQVIDHWTRCRANSCPVCQPVKQPERYLRAVMDNAAAAPRLNDKASPGRSNAREAYAPLMSCVNAMDSDHGVANFLRTVDLRLPCYMKAGQATATPAESTQNWQQAFAAEARDRIVNELIDAIIPHPEARRSAYEGRLQNFIGYVRAIEVCMYKEAKSRIEYYLLLADKVSKIQKKLEVARERRKEILLQRRQP